MKTINYIKGDVTQPITEGNKFIIHVCNDIGAFGAGVALAIGKKWPVVKTKYKEWSNKDDFKLGNIQHVKVEKDLVVINMIAQHNIITINNIPPIRYDALQLCVKKVSDLALFNKVSVNIPYLMGCGLAGGSWNIVEKILIEELCEKGIAVIAYDIDGLITKETL